MHILGSAVIKATFGKKSYDLSMVTVQAIVLTAFNAEDNNNSPRNYADLLDNLNIPDEILKRVLHSLSMGKFKILKRIAATTDASSSSSAAAPATGAGGSGGSGGGIKATDSFIVNEGFSSPMRKVRIPMAALEESHNIKRVEEDRSIAIEAAIVRIMKVQYSLTAGLCCLSVV